MVYLAAKSKGKKTGKMILMVWLRWLCVPISVPLLAAVVLIIARTAFFATNNLCTENSLHAGLCVESWHTTAMDVIVYFTTLSLAVGLVILPSLIAPRFKKAIAVIGFFLASFAPGFIYYNTRWPDLMVPLVLTLLFSGVSVYWVWRKDARVEHVM